jgi:gliding motility-associated lipoprotein GldD
MPKKIATKLILILPTMIMILSLAFLIKERVTTHYIPKPRGYHRIVLPAHEYTQLQGTYPYTFEFSKHAIIEENKSKYKEKYWIHIYYPKFDATIHITYKPVKNNTKLLNAYLDDTYNLIVKHQVKASAIEERILKMPHGQIATIIEISGEVPTQFQFHTTDNRYHFLRGALYFNTASQNDFLEPIIEFIKTDMIHLLNTLQWHELT